MWSLFDRTWTIACIVMCCITLLLAQETWRDNALRTSVAMLDVGQGDSILFTTSRGGTILVDGGPDASTLRALGQLRPFFARDIDLLVLTHPHLDHLAAFPELLRRGHVRAILLPVSDASLPRYEELLAVAAQESVPLIAASRGQHIAFDDFSAAVLWPDPRADIARKINNVSVVLRIDLGRHRIIATGDAEAATEDALLRSGTDLTGDIMKIGHHGSHTSTTLSFLSAVHPAIALISVGRDNRYGHPHHDILDRLMSWGIRIYRTDVDGTVVLPLGMRYTAPLDAGSPLARRPIAPLLAA